jgi:hypothetical protein
MEPRARYRTLLRRAGISAALAALLVPAVAGTADAKKKPKAPVISSIHPTSLAIGETLTIRGHNFRKGRNKNTVAFKRRGHAAVFVQAGIGTKKMLRVKLTSRLERVLVVRNGETVPTRLGLRVLSARFGKKFTTGKRMPLVWPPKPEGDDNTIDPAKVDPNGDCDGDKVKNAIDTDDDNDLLPDTVENKLKTDQCKFDTDGDGVADGYEYQSAVDLNDNEYQAPINQIVPHPYKVPYPNALYADSDVDYDGDSLTLGEEFSLWKAYRNPAAGLNDLVYSDGNQYSAYKRDGSGHRPGSLVGADPVLKYASFIGWAQATGYWNITVPIHGSLVPVLIDDTDFSGTITPAESAWWDEDHNGKLSDDERDEDADGLSNYDEAHGRMLSQYWSSCYSGEKAYPIVYGGTDLTDPDTDGDGVRDGADDQDHDDLPNLMELSRHAAAPLHSIGGNCKVEEGEDADPAYAKGMVNPFNPCLPYTDSRTCTRHPSFDSAPAPFSMAAKDIYYVLN